MATTVRPRCFLDIQHGTDPVGRVVIELFTDKTPKTCENFRALCTGSKSPELHYKSTIFHRVIEEFMVQGGDITRGDGKGGMSIYGETFEDENLGWCDIDKEGLVCMANRGKDTNSSQFFITCAPCDHLNGKHTVFGHVVAGLQFVKQIETFNVDSSDKPTVDVIIANCGELEFRRAAAPIKAKVTTATGTSRDRKRLRSLAVAEVKTGMSTGTGVEREVEVPEGSQIAISGDEMLGPVDDTTARDPLATTTNQKSLSHPKTSDIHPAPGHPINQLRPSTSGAIHIRHGTTGPVEPIRAPALARVPVTATSPGTTMTTTTTPKKNGEYNGKKKSARVCDDSSNSNSILNGHTARHRAGAITMPLTTQDRK
ncbi:Phosphatase [Drechslerella dactyloides]|uniref:peptidylprolyl isomerase n=1 Tax=Drechslerella dactyloides TaxID=74499 RepID=A0AAD6J196_DREDA|nr:Phosphatase [Drechslerella dactyloides]